MPRARKGAPPRGNLALVNGVPNTEKSAAADVQPAVPEKPIRCQKNKALSAAWDELVPALAETGFLAGADAHTIEICLRHYLISVRASEEVLREDSVKVWDDKNERWQKNPAEPVFRMESASFLEYAKQLGMTFMARARTPGKDRRQSDDNPFSASG